MDLSDREQVLFRIFEQLKTDDAARTQTGQFKVDTINSILRFIGLDIANRTEIDRSHQRYQETEAAETDRE